MPMSESDDLGNGVTPPSFASLNETTDEICDSYRDMPYEEFLRTEYWAVVRDHLVGKVGKCQLCSSRSNLAVHHNSYQHHGREHQHLEDLIVVCDRCHMYFHRLQRPNNEVPALYQNASFENFRLNRDNPISYRALTEVFLQVRSYVREFPKADRPGLLLIGAPGSGKTHLAAAAFNALRGQGRRGIFYDYQSLAERLATGARDGSGLAELDVCRTADVLFLDDVGSQRPKDWLEDAILSLVKHRCNERKPLIATTSLADPRTRKPEDRISYATQLAERIGEPARSRLFEMCRVVAMPLIPDFRVEGDRVG
jgi:DNA replication protein DnaC